MILICTAGSLLCIFYYIALVLHNRFWQLDFSIFWLMLGIALAGVSIFLRYEKKHGQIVPMWIERMAFASTVIFLLVVLWLGSLVIRGMNAEVPSNLSYVIVLGAHVRGDVPSKALRKRLDRALAYVNENPKAILILSGGQGYGENISEAECMRRYLVEHDIPENRMVLEDRSTSTRENLLFSNRLTGCQTEETGLVSNDFHIYRAVRLARSLGFTKVHGIAAPTDTIAKPNYIFRETLALIKAQLLNHL